MKKWIKKILLKSEIFFFASWWTLYRKNISAYQQI